MRNHDIVDEYKDFLYGKVTNKGHQLADYCLLLDCLFKIPFESFIPMDENRIEDAKYMKREWVKNEYGGRLTCELVDNRYISVLEVLIALACRMENDILCDPMEEIDHSADHFWVFLKNLDIEKYSNDNFRELNIRDKVEKWVRREFTKEGKGSIFPVTKPKNDMRKLEIWDQMSAYILENYYKMR